MKLIELELKEYLKALRSDAPAPGGGSVSALAGVQGVAMLEMVADLTIGREKYKEYEADCIGVKNKCTSLYESLLAAIDKDTEAYLAVSNAFRLPKETDEEKAARSKAIAEATLVATLVPYETLTYCFEGILLAEKLVGKSNPNAASDVGVAALSFLAGLEGAWLNVKINLPGIKDKSKVEHFTQEGMRFCEEGKLRATKIYTEIEKGL